MEPLISVIVPVYNAEKYLDQCLESIVAQRYRHLEIIVVDDGSTDTSGERIDRWAERDERIRVIHQPNGGYGKAMNAGLRAATGEYFAFISGLASKPPVASLTLLAVMV